MLSDQSDRGFAKAAVRPDIVDLKARVRDLSPPSQCSSAAQSWKGAAVKVLVSVVLLMLLLWRTDFHAVLESTDKLSTRTWAFNFILFLGSCATAGAKWKLLLPEEPFARLLRLNFIGQYYGMLLPGQIAGEAVKAYRLGKGRPDAERIAASVVIDRITGFLGLLLVATVGVAFSATAGRRQILIVLLAFCLFLIMALFVFHLQRWTYLFDVLQKRGARHACLAGGLRRLFEAWRTYVRSPLLLLISVLIGALFQMIAVWISYRIGRELGLRIAVADWCWIFGVVSIATALPFTIGGLGLREGSFVASLALLGIAPEKAVAVSFGVFTLMLAGAAIGGLLEWTRPAADRRI